MTVSSKMLILLASLSCCGILGYLASATRCPQARAICVFGFIAETIIAAAFLLL